MIHPVRHGRGSASRAFYGCLASLGLISAAYAAEPKLAELRAAAPVEGGLVVHIGATDGSLAVDLAKAHPVVVLAVTGDAASAAALRQRLASGGVHGQATVAMLADGRVPVIDSAAAVVVADLDAAPGASQEEALRVARPFGRVWLKQKGAWSTVDKPRPTGADDWAQYHYNAAMSDKSEDRLAGPARGIQWQSGPQYRSSDGVRVVGPTALFLEEGIPTARDAYSGLVLWRRPDLKSISKYTWLSDRERAYIWTGAWGIPGETMLALDLRTGKTVREYREGITFVPPKEGWHRDDKSPERRALAQRAHDLQARLTDDGKLLQISSHELVLLEAATGRRLWAQNAAEGKIWVHPLISDGRLYVIEGVSAKSESYTHWPMGTLERIACFDLATGAERWTYQPPAERALAAYNMSVGGGRLALLARDNPKGKGKAVILVLSSADGKEVAFLPEAMNPPGRKNELGGGHSGMRINMVGDRIFVSSIGTVVGSVAISDPTGAVDRPYLNTSRPVGCTVFRYTPNWAFGSLTTYGLAESNILHTNAARTACDVGAFPANGMTYITPNHCFCQPYLPGSLAFHPRPFAGEEQIERLEAGSARPAPAPLLTSGNSGWPMLLGNNERGAWVDDPLPATLRPLWQAKPAGEFTGSEQVTKAWDDHWFIEGPVTQASVVDDLVVLAAGHRQQVMAYDARDGKLRWNSSVEGRVDTAPTIAGNLVVFGTRAGYVYALDSQSGALVWRFLAAPRRQYIVVDGQLESTWPVLGSVVVDDNGVWAVAGRHSEADGGLWWWRLDLATGQARAKGRFGQDQLLNTTTMTGTMANLVVLDESIFQMPGLRMQVDQGTLKPWTSPHKPAGRAEERDGWIEGYRMGTLKLGNQGLLARPEIMNGYMLTQYAATSGRLYAHKGDDFVKVAGAPGFQHRGGQGGSSLERLRRLPEISQKPEIRGAELVWSAPERIWHGNGIAALAVAGDTVLVGMEVIHNDHHKERDRMRYRLRTYDYAKGEKFTDYPLPARPLLGGISSDKGRVFVVTKDGTLSAFGQ